jgi:Rieske Fe-S protein
MEKNTTGLKNCANDELDSDDRAPYKISRRSFLGSSALVVLPALCTGCPGTNGPDVIPLPDVANNKIVIPLAEFPDLMRVGGSILGQAKGFPDPIVIAHVDTATFVALDAVCTHMRCFVSYNALNVELDCPCHGSTYEIDGRVIGGPAPAPLTRFTASSDGTNVTVTLA